MELSRFIWFFVDLGGTVTGRVMDNKPRRSPIPSAGLEIKLLLTFSGTNQDMMNQMRGIIRSYSYEYTGVQPPHISSRTMKTPNLQTMKLNTIDLIFFFIYVL